MYVVTKIGGPEGTPIAVNLDRVRYFEPTADGKGTVLYFDADDRYERIAMTYNELAGHLVTRTFAF